MSLEDGPDKKMLETKYLLNEWIKNYNTRLKQERKKLISKATKKEPIIDVTF